ncbi:MAG: hypothetical protein IPL13_11165 [Saprospiraceae bacterium]|nr:hypothetical protein [Candidatus Brachybacter algidus]
MVNKEIELVSKLEFYEAKGVKVFKDKIYLLADNDDGNYGLFECTGTAASIKLIKKLKPFNGISDQTIHWFEFKDKLYFHSILRQMNRVQYILLMARRMAPVNW